MQTMEKKKAASKARTVALERGLSILTAFNHDRAVLSLAELAATTRLYKSAILRYSTSLIDLGFLQRTNDGRYRLGPATFQLGRIYQRSFHRSAVVLPVLRDLVAETGESAAFYIRDGGSDVCLYRIESPHPVRDAGVNEGDRFPLDESACSTVLSAFSGDESTFEARTDLVVVARHSVRFPGVSAIACPVFAFDQKLAGAFLLSGPEVRFSDAVVAKMKRSVAEHAAALTRSLGGNGDIFQAFLTAQSVLDDRS
jgi:DNA-binding IclR family transcriptional regulator